MEGEDPRGAGRRGVFAKNTLVILRSTFNEGEAISRSGATFPSPEPQLAV